MGLFVWTPVHLLLWLRSAQQVPPPPWNSWIILAAVASMAVAIEGWGIRKLLRLAEDHRGHEERTTALEKRMEGDNGIVARFTRMEASQDQQTRLLERVAEAVVGERGLQNAMTRMEKEIARVAEMVTVKNAEFAVLQKDVARNTAVLFRRAGDQKPESD